MLSLILVCRTIPDFSNSIALNDAWADGVDVCGARANDSNNLDDNAGLNCDDQNQFHS